MSNFLNNHELGLAIVNLMKGTGLRCAVAFWGNGAARRLFQDGHPPEGTQIICDLAMGGTNPKELVALGAPDNERLKHLCGLHAKVYISDQGIIVCSANASNNGIGFLQTPGLVEAGTFHSSTSAVYAAAATWFEEIWELADVVDELALGRAEEAWQHRSSNAPSLTRTPNPASLFDTVIANRQRFRGVGFAFTTGSATVRQRDETALSVIEDDELNPVPLLSANDQNAVSNWPVSNVFSEWPSEDIDRWPRRFVCVHRNGSGRLSYWFYERAYTAVLGDTRGMLLARRPGNLRGILGFKIGAEAMAAADNENASSIFAQIEETGHHLCANGDELSRFLTTLGPWR